MGSASGKMFGGVKITAEGGKGDFEFEISLAESVVLYDFDGEEMEDKKFLLEEVSPDWESKPEYTNMVELVKDLVSRSKVKFSKTALEEGGYRVDAMSFPRISGISG